MPEQQQQQQQQQQQLQNPQINASCFDLLIIEIVPLALRVINETAAAGTTASTVNDDDVYYKIEQFGFKLGRNLAEIFTRERERFQNQLDVMKFICKELWPVIFKKQIDNLKTNHRVRKFCHYIARHRDTIPALGPLSSRFICQILALIFFFFFY